ncbi:MAG: hypothetical protein RLZZ214_2494 [Verrucomicrobiota bacterium]|jgi:hypothetical protein
MRHREIMSPIDWVRRVNRSWLVRSNLNEHADAWLDHLAVLDDGRLLKSCQIARVLCDRRRPEDDPKPWFYAGLFQLATAEEAVRFLETHRVTKALVPAMAEDPDVQLWLDRVGPETRELLARLRLDLAQVRQAHSSALA